MGKAKTQINEMDQQAADWFVLVSDPQVEEDQLVAFMSWLNESPEHKAAYERTERMWGNLDCVEADFHSKGEDQVDQPVFKAGHSRTGSDGLVRWGGALAASLLIAVVGYLFFPQAEVYDEINLQTAIGIQKTQQLSDQSEITLNTDSAVRVAYTEEVRRIYLERGEAYFDVAKQADRPFVVIVAGSEVKALGTAFNVRLLEDEQQVKQVVVSLVKGSIAVVPTSGTPESILLSGQQAQYSGGSNFVQLQDADLESITQWRSGQLSFVGMALEEVIFEINRYTPTPLVLSDKSIGKEVVDAYFQIDNLNNFLMGLDRLFGVESVRRENRIFLTRREHTDT